MEDSADKLPHYENLFAELQNEARESHQGLYRGG